MLNSREPESRGLGIRQPSESAPGRTFGGGQDGGDDDLVQSTRSRGKSYRFGYTFAY